MVFDGHQDVDKTLSSASGDENLIELQRSAHFPNRLGLLTHRDSCRYRQMQVLPTQSFVEIQEIKGLESGMSLFSRQALSPTGGLQRWICKAMMFGAILLRCFTLWMPLQSTPSLWWAAVMLFCRHILRRTRCLPLVSIFNPHCNSAHYMTDRMALDMADVVAA